jgi:integrase/recombinase XerC
LNKLIDKQKVLFLESLEEQKGYSDLTIKSYDESINEALCFVIPYEENGILIFDLMPYRLHIAKLNSKTISKKLSALHSFALYLNDNKIKTLLKSDESVKVTKTLPKPVLHKYIVEAIQKADTQERVIVTLLYTLGLRISELASMQIENISDEWIRIVGKGDKQRDIPLLASSKKILDDYLDRFNIKKFLFEKNGERLSENSLRYTITKVFKRVGIKVTPHQLRHSYATSLLNAGAPIADVSELLGHSSMATTQIYTKLGSALKQKNYNKAHPLCGVSE